MAGRFVNPFPQFLDSTPEVRSGARLFFYAAGTSTKLNTYSDRGLTIANTNPVVLNSAGFPSVDIYLQDLDYKVVLAPATDSDPPAAPIWTADYVRARDSALIAKTVTGSGSPNGSVAGTAGSASILPDFYWDYTSSILYVCTTTGTSSTAVWTAVNASSATPSVPPPQGRLTLTSATPVLTSGVTAGTSLYYTPYVGNLVPIYNGASMVPTAFSELTLSLVSSHAANTIYDVFVFSKSGVLTLVTGPAWTNSSAATGARGSGSSTTELTRIGGMYVNAVAMSARNGSTTYNVGANLATYLGSILIDGSAGQLTCHTAFGQSRKWGVWNAYNQQQIFLIAGATGDYTSNTTTGWRAANASTANSLQTFVGLPGIAVKVSRKVNMYSSSGNASPMIGIGLNSTSSPTGLVAGNYTGATGSASVNNVSMVAELFRRDRFGMDVFTALEQAQNTGTAQWLGGENFNVLSAEWLG